jgi:NADH-quinone oxidoreductase subunit M
VIGALLFAMVGTVIYTRTKTRMLDELHRLMDRMPGIAWVFIVVALASMGLPGFSGFVSELYVLLGAWATLPVWIVIAAGVGVLATFGYTLVKIHEAFFRARSIGNNDNNGDNNDANDADYSPMTLPEKAGVALLLGASLLIGLCPWLLTNHIAGSLQLLLNRFN